MYTPAKERYETMEYNRCGESGLMLPKVSLGLWHNFGDTSDYENMKQRVKKIQQQNGIIIDLKGEAMKN